jgi:hypothetical protein
MSGGQGGLLSGLPHQAHDRHASPQPWEDGIDSFLAINTIILMKRVTGHAAVCSSPTNQAITYKSSFSSWIADHVPQGYVSYLCVSVLLEPEVVLPVDPNMDQTPAIPVKFKHTAVVFVRASTFYWE